MHTTTTSAFLVYYPFFMLFHCQALSGNPEWMKLIPESDLQPILLAQATQDDDVIEPPVTNLFQGDLKGCTANNNPACPPATDITQWKKNPNGKVFINVVIASGLTDDLRVLIQDQAQQSIEDQTCLIFDEPGDDSKQVIKYVPGDGCFADWGGSKNPALLISLNHTCVDNKVSNILRLIFHALGFSKEHTRNDRDNFIKIYLENVAEGHKDADFRMDDESISYDDPYDYESVMHPGYLFLAKSPFIPTISGVTKIPIGSRSGMSQYDVLKLKRKFCGLKTPPRTRPTVATIPEPAVAISVAPPPATTRPETDEGDKNLKPIKIQISPTPTKRCHVGTKMTIRNMQTNSRTTTTTVYPFAVSKEFSTKGFAQSLFPHDEDEGKDWLATGYDYPEFSYSGNKILTVRTTNINPATKVFQTVYSDQSLPGDVIISQEKLETRILQC